MAFLFWYIACCGLSADPAQPPDVKSLIENLRSPRAEVRVEAATALAKVPHIEKDLVVALGAALQDPEDAVRYHAVGTLLHLVHRVRYNTQPPPYKNRPAQLDPILPELKKALADSNRGVRFTTRNLLSAIEQDYKKTMAEIMDGNDERERIVVAGDFLALVYDPRMETPERKRAADIAQAALKHPNLALRLEAASAPTQGREVIAGIITEGFQSKDAVHRKAALTAFLRHGSTVAVDLKLVLDNIDQLEDQFGDQSRGIFSGILTKLLQQSPNPELLPTLTRQADNPKLAL